MQSAAGSAPEAGGWGGGGSPDQGDLAPLLSSHQPPPQMAPVRLASCRLIFTDKGAESRPVVQRWATALGRVGQGPHAWGLRTISLNHLLGALAAAKFSSAPMLSHQQGVVCATGRLPVLGILPPNVVCRVPDLKEGFTGQARGSEGPYTDTRRAPLSWTWLWVL